MGDDLWPKLSSMKHHSYKKKPQTPTMTSNFSSSLNSHFPIAKKPTHCFLFFDNHGVKQRLLRRYTRIEERKISWTIAPPTLHVYTHIFIETTTIELVKVITCK